MVDAALKRMLTNTADRAEEDLKRSLNALAEHTASLAAQTRPLSPDEARRVIQYTVELLSLAQIARDSRWAHNMIVED